MRDAKRERRMMDERKALAEIVQRVRKHRLSDGNKKDLEEFERHVNQMWERLTKEEIAAGEKIKISLTWSI